MTKLAVPIYDICFQRYDKKIYIDRVKHREIHNLSYIYAKLSHMMLCLYSQRRRESNSR